jgi:hypothetical protein
MLRLQFSPPSIYSTVIILIRGYYHCSRNIIKCVIDIYLSMISMIYMISMISIYLSIYLTFIDFFFIL